MMTFAISLTMDNGAIATYAVVSEVHGYAKKGTFDIVVECYLDQAAFNSGFDPMRTHHMTLSVVPVAVQMAAVNSVLLPLVQAQFGIETAESAGE